MIYLTKLVATEKKRTGYGEKYWCSSMMRATEGVFL